MGCCDDGDDLAYEKEMYSTRNLYPFPFNDIALAVVCWERNIIKRYEVEEEENHDLYTWNKKESLWIYITNNINFISRYFQHFMYEKLIKYIWTMK